jgi:DNA-binding MarR family transcriptional regulator
MLERQGQAPARPAREAELARAAAFHTQLRRFLAVTGAAAAEAGLTTQRYDLLMMRTADELRVTDLCELLQLKQSSVTELVARRADAGLIERRASTSDRRNMILQLTADGDQRLMLAFTALRDHREALAAEFQEVERRFRDADGSRGLPRWS